MSFDVDELRAATALHGSVVRIVVAATQGSVPRETGAAMLVWPGGQSGTIGGGALEHAAVGAARQGRRGLSRHPLGPGLGQCCGGAVTLLTEDWNAAALDELGDVVARGDGNMPLSVRRILDRRRREGRSLGPCFLDGWMVEPVSVERRPIWVWGAGHVGRAIVAVLAPLPDVAITWIDTDRERFPSILPPDVAFLVASDPALAAEHAPHAARHLILTYSHTIDLALCHALLTRGFDSAGLIGSKTKWARFRTRLRALGHTDAAISRIHCPIGRTAFGKHPQAIAVGVAVTLLEMDVRSGRREEAG